MEASDRKAASASASDGGRTQRSNLDNSSRRKLRLLERQRTRFPDISEFGKWVALLFRQDGQFLSPKIF